MNYELAFVLNGRTDKKKCEDTVEQIQELIVKHDGSVRKLDEWGKRRLAYEIQKVREGFYYFLTYTSEDTAKASIENGLREMDTVLRFLIVQTED